MMTGWPHRSVDGAVLGSPAAKPSAWDVGDSLEL